jgi:hypothetical protein
MTMRCSCVMARAAWRSARRSTSILHVHPLPNRKTVPRGRAKSHFIAFRDLFLPLEDGRKKQGRNRKALPDHVYLPLLPTCFWMDPPFPSLSFLPTPPPPPASTLHFCAHSNLPSSFWRPPRFNVARDEKQRASTRAHARPLPFTSALSAKNVESQPLLSLFRLFVHA